MIQLEKLEHYTNQLLKSDSIQDYVPNGVQIRGKKTIHRVVSGVSACLDLFEQAVQHKADLILVHHGMFWDKESRIIEGRLKKRIKLLLEKDITLMAYHLPLDCHPELGNNSQILKLLKLKKSEPFGLYRGTHLSFVGETDSKQTLDSFTQQVRTLFGGTPLILPFGPKTIRRVAICSGGAPELISEALEKGADLFLSGEASEPLYHIAKEEKIHVIAAGHHKTELFGVQALGNHLKKHFDLSHTFIDIPNPL